MTRLSGRRAVVVGAGSVGEGVGNGRATALVLAREGAEVVCVDRDAASAEDTAARIAKEGGSAEALALDATDPGALQGMAADLDARPGGIGILVHVVGISPPGSAVETDPADWDRVFEVNLRSAYLAARAVVPGMASRGSGSVVFVSSIAAVWASGYSYAAYEASKAGLNRLTRTLARAHAAEGVRVNAVMPGLIDTPHVKAFIAPSQKSSSGTDRAAAVPMKRQGTPWEVAGAILFLVSDDAGYVTGACLPVDGGLSA